MTTMTDRPATKTRILRAIPIALLALFLLGAGVPKLLSVDTPQGGGHADFERWGYPDGFRHVVGLAETAGALMLLLPKPRVLGATPRFWGAALLALDMTGAIATHLAHAEAHLAPLPLILLATSAGIALATRPAWLRRSTPKPTPRATG